MTKYGQTRISINGSSSSYLLTYVWKTDNRLNVFDRFEKKFVEHITTAVL